MSLSLPVHKRTSLDNSILSSTGRCPRLAYYNYHLCRATRTENYPINFGVAYHEFRDSLEKLYQQWVVEEGEDFDEIIDRFWSVAWSLATKTWVDPPVEHKKSYLDFSRLRSSCEEAFDVWQEEKRLGYYKVIQSETAFQLPLPRRLCHECYQWTTSKRCCNFDTHQEFFTGRLDQIIEWNGRLWIRDFKTVGRKEDWDSKFNPDHQFTGYVWAGKSLSGRAVDGVIIDIVYNIKTKGPEFHPTLANRTNDDIQNWLEWFEFEYANYRRFEATDSWPMRTSACGDYGGCFFRRCCNSGSWDSIEHWLEENTIYSVWDPLNPEREEGLPE